MPAKVRKWPVPRRGSFTEIKDLIERYHPYGSHGSAGEVWVAEESGEVVAGWAWQPPPFGAAKAVSPGCPAGALSLSRMVAVPKRDRDWHISKPLKWIMKNGIDRGRWPVLVTYSDAGEGHCGNVYKCSGWARDGSRKSARFNDKSGNRRSIYSCGSRASGLVRAGSSEITRWVHRVCEKGYELEHMISNGWSRVETGKRWKSGSKAYKWVKADDCRH